MHYNHQETFTLYMWGKIRYAIKMSPSKRNVQLYAPSLRKE